MKASYDFDSFIRCCATEPENVVIFNKAQKDAREIFQLNTTKEILDFIGNNGLEKPDFINTKIWEKNPDKNTPRYVDAYKFWTLSMHCYIAFMFNPINKKWLIKSFHLSDKRETTLADAFKKVNLKIGKPNE